MSTISGNSAFDSTGSALVLLQQLADRAEPLALERFRKRDLRVETKPDTSLVTEADLAIEQQVRDDVHARFPELVVCGEEQGQGEDQGAGRLWIDPIDSTANFARGIPIFGILLAVEVAGEIVAALVSAPALQTRWWASLGGGAFRNGKPIQVSRVSELSLAQAFHGSLGGYEAPALPAGEHRLLTRTRRQRGFGDFYQHVLVAEGAGEFAIDPVVNPWDVAPLGLIAREAGGNATSLAGRDDLFAGNWVTTNGRLHDQVLAALSDAPCAGTEPG